MIKLPGVGIEKAMSLELDVLLENIDLKKLSELCSAGSKEVLGPFDNRFFNQFVNNPNFTKRL